MLIKFGIWLRRVAIALQSCELPNSTTERRKGLYEALDEIESQSWLWQSSACAATQVGLMRSYKVLKKCELHLLKETDCPAILKDRLSMTVHLIRCTSARMCKVIKDGSCICSINSYWSRYDPSMICLSFSKFCESIQLFRSFSVKKS